MSSEESKNLTKEGQLRKHWALKNFNVDDRVSWLLHTDILILVSRSWISLRNYNNSGECESKPFTIIKRLRNALCSKLDYFYAIMNYYWQVHDYIEIWSLW